MFAIFLSLALLVPAVFAGLLPNVTGNYSDQRFWLCLTTWLVIIAIVARNVVSPFSFRQLQGVIWSLPLILVFLSGEFYPSAYRVEPLMYVYFFGGAAILGGYLSTFSHQQKLLSGLVFVVVGICLLYGLIALMVFGFATRDGQSEVDDFITWGFPNIRYWSHVATWLMPLLAVAQIRAGELPGTLIPKLVTLAGGLWWWILLSTAARGSAIGLVVGVGFVYFWFGRASYGVLKSLLKQLLLGSGFSLLMTVLLPWLWFGASDFQPVDTGTSGRIPLWLEAWRMSLVNFPFGMGPQSWLTHEVITEAYRSSKSFGHPHNMYLLWAAEYGWISIMALFVMFSGVAKYLWDMRLTLRAGRGVETDVLIGLTMACVAAAVHSAVSAVFLAPASMLAGFLILSFFWGRLLSTAKVEPGKLRASPNSKLPRVFAVLVLLGSGFSGYWWLSEVERYYQDNQVDKEAYMGDRAIGSPRFWSHGDFPRQLKE